MSPTRLLQFAVPRAYSNSTLLMAGLLLSLPFAFNPGFETVEEILWILGLKQTGTLALVDWNPFSPGFYRPLSYFAAFLPFQFFGSSPLLVHLCTMLLNLFNAALFFRLLQSLRLPRHSSALASCLFLLAPAVQPAVSYPLVVHDQLCATFFLAFFLWLRHENTNPQKHALLSLVLALGAMMSKESWLLLWPLLLFYGFAVKRTARWNSAFALVSILTLVYLPLRWEALTQLSGSSLFYETKIAHVPLNLLQHYLFYFLPGLGIIYRMFMGTGGAGYSLSLYPVAAISFALLIILWRNSRKTCGYFLLFFTLALGPVLLLHGPAAHQAYLASFGVSTILAYLFFSTRGLARGITLAAILLLFAHAAVLGVRKYEKASFQNRFLASFGENLKSLDWSQPLAVIIPRPDSADYMELNVVDLILRRKQDWGSLFGVKANFGGEVYWHTFRWMDSRSPPSGLTQVVLVDREGNAKRGSSADLP